MSQSLLRGCVIVRELMPSPTTTGRRTRAPAERRSSLVRAALRVMSERGIGAATVSDIAAAAGVAKGTFYLYFASKEALLEAVHLELAEEMVGELERISLPGGRDGWREFTVTLVGAAFDLHGRFQDLHELLMAVPHQREHTSWSHAPSPVATWVSGIIARGIASGGYHVDDVEMTTGLLHEVIHGAASAASERPLERARIEKATADLVVRTLGA